jgi:hypothetical protein
MYAGSIPVTYLLINKKRQEKSNQEIKEKARIKRERKKKRYNAFH